jgi:hypothetical protein
MGKHAVQRAGWLEGTHLTCLVCSIRTAGPETAWHTVASPLGLWRRRSEPLAAAEAERVCEVGTLCAQHRTDLTAGALQVLRLMGMTSARNCKGGMLGMMASLMPSVVHDTV